MDDSKEGRGSERIFCLRQAPIFLLALEGYSYSHSRRISTARPSHAALDRKFRNIGHLALGLNLTLKHAAGVHRLGRTLIAPKACCEHVTCQQSPVGNRTDPS